MRIEGYESDALVLHELGERLKQHRVASNITQAELSEKTGVSVSTLVRIEAGEDTKASNLLKILRALNLLSNADLLVPEPHQDFKAAFEGTRERKRARKKTNTQSFIWGDEQRS